jgi:hypothetical protein
LKQKKYSKSTKPPVFTGGRKEDKDMMYRGYEIKKVNAVSKRTGKTVEAYKAVGKIVATITEAKQNIDLYRLCNIKSVDCK